MSCTNVIANNHAQIALSQIWNCKKRLKFPYRKLVRNRLSPRPTTLTTYANMQRQKKHTTSSLKPCEKYIIFDGGRLSPHTPNMKRHEYTFLNETLSEVDFSATRDSHHICQTFRDPQLSTPVPNLELQKMHIIASLKAYQKQIISATRDCWRHRH